MRVRRLVPADWQTWRDVRLASLADAPYAFGSSLALEQQFDEAAWRARLANGMAAVAFVGEDPVGTIAGYVPEDGNDPILVAVWVHADARGKGVGDALVAEMLGWSRELGYKQVYLRVSDGSDAARKLFLRNGFTPTGVRMPLESDPIVGTEFMVQELGAAADGELVQRRRKVMVRSGREPGRNGYRFYQWPGRIVEKEPPRPGISSRWWRQSHVCLS